MAEASMWPSPVGACSWRITSVHAVVCAELCRASAAPGSKRLGSAGVPGLQLRAWGEQAADVTASLSDTRYRSVAVQAEIRLREALERCSAATGAHLDAGKVRTPHRLRTAVCSKLLQELSDLAGPFCGVLQTLCHELVRTVASRQRLPTLRTHPEAGTAHQEGACCNAMLWHVQACSCPQVCCETVGSFPRVYLAMARRTHTAALQAGAIYSDYFASDSGSAAADQLPYFAVAAKLEAENAHYAAQHAAFQAELAENQATVAEVQGRLRVRRRCALAATK
jgi:hypothetical protein